MAVISAMTGSRTHSRPGPRTVARKAAYSFLAVLISLLALLWLPVAQAQQVQPVPALTARVIDRSATLDATQMQALEQKLASFEAERGSQIVVLLVSTTAPEDIVAYAYRVAEEWKIGRRDIGDGVLLVVAKNDRRVRVEVARALEGAVPDLAAYQIIDRLITPAFRNNDFAGGLDAGVDGLMARIRGEDLALPEPEGSAGGDGFAIEDLAAFLFIAVPVAGSFLSGIFGRKLGAAATGGLAGLVVKLLTGSLGLGLLAGVGALIFVIVLGIGVGGGRGGPGGFHRGCGPVIWGGGSRSGGGGFSSGGGGSVGGGGASGRW